MWFIFTFAVLNLNSLLVKRQNDNHSSGSVTGGNKSLALTREVNLATPSSATSAGEIRKSGMSFQSLNSLREEAAYISICASNGSLKYHRVLISTRPSFGDMVICWYTGFTFQTFI